jgi:HK97 gp10 family phage protein
MAGIKYESKSDEVKAAMDQISRKAMEKACLLVEGQAKGLTPVGTGDLRDSMQHTISESDNGFIGKVGSPLMYSVYQEFGTGEFAQNGAGRKGGWWYQEADGTFHFTMGTKPKRMLQTAFRQNKRRITYIFKADLKAGLK